MKLAKVPTSVPKGIKKKKIKKETKKLIYRMRDLQQIMFAQNKYSVLIIFQGMDASGKDNAIKNVFSGLNPLGCNATPFAKPSEEEYAHDFLWRIHQHAPARGMVQIFNRSYYEDILVPTVQKTYPHKTVKARYDDVNNFEKLLADNDTIIIKFFLHIGQERQEEKIRERLVLKRKFWKFDPSDIQARQNRDAYQEVYESIFEKCDLTPWHIVPADKNRYKNYIVAKTIVDAFEKKMKLERPDIEKEEEIYQKLYTGKNKHKELLTLSPKQVEQLNEKMKEKETKKKKK